MPTRSVSSRVGSIFDLLSADVGGTKIGLGSRLCRSDRLFVSGWCRDDQQLHRSGDSRTGDCLCSRMTRAVAFFSRAGQFSIDKDGNLANPAGSGGQGVQLDVAGNPISGLTNIVVSQLVVPPTPTTTVAIAANLDATSTPPTGAIPADAAGTSTVPGTWFAAANFSTVVTIFDSLGQAHDLTVLFRKTGTANQWSYRVTANAGEITGGTAGDLRQVNAVGGLLAFNRMARWIPRRRLLRW